MVLARRKMNGKKKCDVNGMTACGNGRNKQRNIALVSGNGVTMTLSFNAPVSSWSSVQVCINCSSDAGRDFGDC